MSDSQLGLLILLTSVPLFGYYTAWTLITPFIDEDHFIQEYFPDRQIAVVVPIVLMIFIITTLLTFIALVMINSRPSGKQEQPRPRSP
mmetsp:Transcript_7754/g.32679  ORF Transcript_7754/g.32679 Transcript_7754/m.32679 type:complete len:88 (-) Transcript_7754:554-817(-)